MKYMIGIIITVILAVTSNFISSLIPMHLISSGVFAMIIGMFLHDFVKKIPNSQEGIKYTSKKILKTSIVLMGFTLSFSQVLYVGKYSLVVMVFTLIAAFGFGYLFGKIFKMNWKLSSLISAGTGICGGSAIAAIAPTIEADDSYIAYAISATFIFDIVMVIIFPIMGHLLNMSDLGFGLWAGTSINDTSSVVAAGYAFSDAAGRFSTIVKLTRTLSIIPVVIIFGYINQRVKSREILEVSETNNTKKVSVKGIFPWFIVLFIIMVGVRSLSELLVSNGIFNSNMILNISDIISNLSKFFMVMALGAIGLSTDFKKVSKSGYKPMLHGFIISLIVVVVSYVVQLFLGQV